MGANEDDGVQSWEPAPRPAVVRLPVPSTRPLCTYVMAALLVLVWLATTVVGLLAGLGLNGSQSIPVLVAMGAKVNELIVQGQYWRLLTANFLHIGLLHLGFNTYALLLFGTDMERRFGHGRFLVLYLVSGLGGSVLSFVGNEAIAAGASGAVFGLLGAMIAYFLSYRSEFGSYGQRRLSSLLLVAGYNLVMGFVMPGIDNLGHIGGLLVGLALGWAYCPRYVVEANYGTMPRLRDRFSPIRALVLTLLTLLVLAAVVLWRGRGGG
ncbi:MAG: rhomboid family intramembrane serine protease [Anaerolineae bacterium]|jgi:rhomboid protease GluP